MIQQRAVAVRCFLQPLQQVSERRDVELVNLHQLVEFLGVTLMMGDGVMPVGNTDFTVRTVAAVAAQHK